MRGKKAINSKIKMLKYKIVNGKKESEVIR